jgi:hypothetical protein
MDRRDALWNLRFHQLAEYKLAHGHCDVIKNDPNLRLWDRKQRGKKCNNKLSAEREEKLNSIGFDWSRRVEVLDWETRFEQLKEYKKVHGDCNVLQTSDSQNIELKRWVVVQRYRKNKFSLSQQCEAKLNSIGFVWMVRSRADWNVRFQQLLEYKEAVGNCRVPREFRPNPELGRWVAAQRRANRNQTLTKERLEKLNSIGFGFDACKAICITKSRAGMSKTSWVTRFEQLEEYKKANGDCNVSSKDSQNIELGRWVSAQRYKKNNFVLSQQCEEKLNSIGFVWNIRCRGQWNVHFQQLLEYKEAFGDCRVPLQFCHNVQLGHWVQSQRRANKNKFLTKEREEKLNSIGFAWGKQRKDCGWIACKRQREDEHERTHGPLDAPDRCSGNNPPRLHKLATAPLLNNGQKGALETESVAELKTTDNENWDAYFRELLAYFQTHGDFNVPPCYPCKPLLARWVIEQRNLYDLKRRGRQTSLTPLREAKLDAIGFTWFVGGTEEDAPAAEGVSSGVRPEEVISES